MNAGPDDEMTADEICEKYGRVCHEPLGEVAWYCVIPSFLWICAAGSAADPNLIVVQRPTGMVRSTITTRAREATRNADDAARGILTRDATGKIHGVLPKIEALKKAPIETIRENIDTLRKSILARKQELERLGEHGAHRARIGEEEAIPRSLEKHLEDKLGAKNGT